MVTDETKDATAEVAVAEQTGESQEVNAIEATKPSASEDAVKALEAEAKKWEKNYKTLTRTHQNTQAELKAIKQAMADNPSVSAIKRMADIVENMGEESGLPQKVKSELANIRKDLANAQAKASIDTKQGEWREKQNELFSQIEDAGLSPDDKRFRMAKLLFKNGEFDDAKAAVAEVLEEVNKEKPKVAETDVAKLEAEIRAKLIKEYNLDSQDTGGTGGGVPVFTREQIAKMDDATYAKNREKIQEAINAGRIK